MGKCTFFNTLKTKLNRLLNSKTSFSKAHNYNILSTLT